MCHGLISFIPDLNPLSTEDSWKLVFDHEAKV